MNAKELISEITSQIQKNANVRVVFGEPIDKGNLTIIPVAKVQVSGGGGGGGAGAICIPTGGFNIAQAQFQQKTAQDTPSKEKETPSSPGFGMGIGLKIETHPLGYIEIKDGQAKFKEIEDATKVAIAGILLAGFCIFSIFRMMTTVARISQHRSKKNPIVSGKKAQ